MAVAADVPIDSSKVLDVVRYRKGRRAPGDLPERASPPVCRWSHLHEFFASRASQVFTSLEHLLQIFPYPAALTPLEHTILVRARRSCPILSRCHLPPRAVMGESIGRLAHLSAAQEWVSSGRSEELPDEIDPFHLYHGAPGESATSEKHAEDYPNYRRAEKSLRVVRRIEQLSDALPACWLKVAAHTCAMLEGSFLWEMALAESQPQLPVEGDLREDPLSELPSLLRSELGRMATTVRALAWESQLLRLIVAASRPASEQMSQGLTAI